jgi:ABC-type polysaccharide/polyol phosphate export permease
MKLNPMTPIIDGYRQVILLGESPFTADFLSATLLSLLTLGMAWVFFHRAEFDFAESI